MVRIWNLEIVMQVMIFFNDEGDECGGLIYGVSEAGETKNSGMSLSFDQYKK